MMYVLVLFIFLFLTTLGLSILFYSKVDEADKKTSQATAKLEEFVRSGELLKPETAQVIQQAKDANRSVLTNMQTEHSALVRLVTGSGDTSQHGIEEALRAVGVVDNNVVAVMTKLRTDLDKSTQQVALLEKQIKDRQEELQTLKSQYDSTQQDRQQKIAALSAEIKKLKDDYTAYQKSVDDQRDEIAKRLEAAQGASAAEVRQRDNEIRRLEGEVGKRDLRIKELIAQFKTEKPTVPDATREADGKVLAVNPDENLIYINLGQSDHLVLGMTFEVFDALRGVEVNDDGTLRGKASIEVVDMESNTATCRVVRASYNRPVLANDLVANLVYDKDRVFKFYVFGDFDLDGDGKSTLADHDQVVNLITKWGGQVTDPRDRELRMTALLSKDAAGKNLLPLDTDFLVVGQEPELPQPVPPGTRDPAVIKAAIQAKQQWDHYIELRNEAVTLSVPIISQNRFLALIGYYHQQR
ncbi:MAG: hypothetical protein GC162_08490 [Planctomycetes bacterium]|nr:hypothetical protein [Planctomycetota bacterium]